MPTYEFRCAACQQCFEVLYRSLAAAERATPPACPHCGSPSTVRIPSRVAVAGSESSAERPAERPASTTGAPAITPKEQIDAWRQKRTAK